MYKITIESFDLVVSPYPIRHPRLTGNQAKFKSLCIRGFISNSRQALKFKQLARTEKSTTRALLYYTIGSLRHKEAMQFAIAGNIAPITQLNILKKIYEKTIVSSN